MRNPVLTSLAFCASLVLAPRAWAQQPAPAPTPPRAIWQAGRHARTSQEGGRGRRGGSQEERLDDVAIAVVNNDGYLVAFSKMDRPSSPRSRSHSTRPHRSDLPPADQSLSGRPGGQSGQRLSADARRIIASEGGIPIMRDGKIIGAIGCSGGTARRTAKPAKPVSTPSSNNRPLDRGRQTAAAQKPRPSQSRRSR